MVQKTVVRARFRKGKDDDLRAAVEALIRQGHDEADLVRAGLRKLLGLESPGPLLYSVPAADKQLMETPRPEKVKPPLKKAEPPKVEKQNENVLQTDADSALDDLLGM